MTSFSAVERARLADALEAADPAAPTLCEGWTALDLAAHVVVRERRPDSTPGLLLRPLARWTEHVRREYARRPMAELIELIRTGPPATSPFALPGADAAANLTEFFVHCEDVRRGRFPEDRVPAADLAPGLQDELWRRLLRQARLMFRRAGTGVVLATPEGREHEAVRGRSSVRLVGEPGELLLVAFGRGRAADVQREGPP
ncbi:MAG TPA: TIGR03085 family metal-binding protein, partial [Kineosporiaceae bacterium]|nr:TIGR03085 family metal-binding protein [Kineosporiaceae bacterium]